MTEDHAASVKWAVQILEEWGATQAEINRILQVDMRDVPEDRSVEARANLIISMDQNLRVLLPQSHSDWVRLNNDAAMFSGATPLSILIRGRISDMRKIERWLAGWANS